MKKVFFNLFTGLWVLACILAVVVVVAGMGHLLGVFGYAVFPLLFGAYLLGGIINDPHGL